MNLDPVASPDHMQPMQAGRLPLRHSAYVKEAVLSLYSAKQRTLLALLGVVIGIGSVIAMLSVGTIARQQALEQFRELGTEFLVVHLSGGAAASRARIRLADALALSTETSSIAEVAPWSQNRANVVYAGRDVANAEVMGITGSFTELNRLRLAHGRAISDLDHHRYHCVLGARVASTLGGTGAEELMIGESIRLNDRICTVVGTLRPAARSGMMPFEPDQSILMPFSTTLRLFPGQGSLRQVAARMEPEAHHVEATQEVQDHFQRKAPGMQVRVVSAQRVIEQMRRQMQTFALLLAAVGSISLVVGGVGVMNVMLVSVTERRKEIGIRRALGARRFDIRMQFLTESVVLSLVGGALGILVGVSSTWVYCQITDWSFLIDPVAVVLGVCVAGAVGVFFGLQPAHQAARLDPIAALRAG